MKYLLDTNIWLERLLDQQQAATVGRLLAALPTSEMMMSDFTLHSVGVILNRFGQRSVLPQFVQDVLLDGGVLLATVPPRYFSNIVDTMEQFNLDFDDAYQYVLAEQHNAVIVSLDTHFDQTRRGRQTPVQVLSAISKRAE